MDAPEHHWWTELEPYVRRLSATIVIGAVVGAIVGGLGGRLAMRILFLTSGDNVKGLISDDGFEIGRFTLANTIGLVIITGVLGIFAALLYLAARPFIVQFGAFVPLIMAALYGVVGGALIVEPNGVDFRLLEPPALAITLFVLIFAAFGAIVSRLVNAAIGDGGWANRWSWWIVAPPLAALLFPPLLIVALVAFILQGGDQPTRVWRSVRVGAWATMALMFSLGAVNLTSDAVELI